MIAGFQCLVDPAGDIQVADGVVCQLRSGVRLAVGAGSRFSSAPGRRDGGYFQPVPFAASSTFVGGSGRNLLLTGLTVPTSGAVPPVGLFRPGRPDVFHRGIFTLEVTGASAATIHDGTDTVAILSAGGAAPVGGYLATTYGENTYGGAATFTITAALEIAGGGAIPDCLASVNAGDLMTTLASGVFTAVDAANYVSADDADWAIVIDSDGSAELLNLAVPIATRAAGSATDPAGTYAATATGMAAHNLTPDEPVDGEAFDVLLSVTRRQSRAGYVYLAVTEVAGVLTSVEGPHFATALPADTTTLFHFAVAQSDGADFEQLHTGALIWAEVGTVGATGAAGTGLTWTTITASDYAALSDPDRESTTVVYNVIPDP